MAFDDNGKNKPGGIWWSEGGRKGWKMAGDKRYVQNYKHNGQYVDVSDGLTAYSWMYEDGWGDHDPFITYANPADNDILVKSVTMEVISNNSGGRQFYGIGGGIRIQPPAPGKAATYSCILQIYESYGTYPSKPQFVSRTASIQIPQNDHVNLVHPGSPSHAATFSYTGPYSKHKFDFTDQKIVIPRGGLMIIRLAVSNFQGPGTGYIQFNFQSENSPELESEDLIRPYIWKYETPEGESSPRWHLVKPAYIMQSDGWKPLEDILFPESRG